MPYHPLYKTDVQPQGGFFLPFFSEGGSRLGQSLYRSGGNQNWNKLQGLFYITPTFSAL